MKRFLFLIAWDDLTQGQDYLLSEYISSPDSVSAFRIDAPNEDVAGAIGLAKAFLTGYSQGSSISTYMEIDPSKGIPDIESTTLITVDCSEK